MSFSGSIDNVSEISRPAYNRSQSYQPTMYEEYFLSKQAIEESKHNSSAENVSNDDDNIT